MVPIEKYNIRFLRRSSRLFFVDSRSDRLFMPPMREFAKTCPSTPFTKSVLFSPQPERSLIDNPVCSSVRASRTYPRKYYHSLVRHTTHDTRKTDAFKFVSTWIRSINKPCQQQWSQHHAWNELLIVDSASSTADVTHTKPMKTLKKKRTPLPPTAATLTTPPTSPTSSFRFRKPRIVQITFF